MKRNNEEEKLDWLREIIRNAPPAGASVLKWVRRTSRGITGPGRSLGVFPSSFNPPTVAHRTLIERARHVESLDEILLILDRKPLDKSISGASLEERLSMMLLFCEGDPSVSVAFTNRGLFVEKLALLQKAYPSGTIFRFIVGYDTLIRILDAKYYKDRETALGRLFSDSEFLVANRERANIDEIQEHIDREENRWFSERIKPFEIPLAVGRLSSTQARHAIRRGETVEGIVPPEIASYIRQKGLYKNLRQK